MNIHFARASALIGQSRFDLAEPELRQGLAEDPDDGWGHAMLAICLAGTERYKEATESARAAIGSAPDASFSHYAMAVVLHDRNRLDEAGRAIEEAIRLDPQEAPYHALRANILFQQRQWPAALQAAEQGMAIDPGNTQCANIRAIALTRMGRKQEAHAALHAALADEPEESVTHANLGWNLLYQHQPAKALEHFREALRLDPENEWARQGIVASLRAKNIVYGLMLRYFLWMSALSPGVRWGLIIGAYVAFRMLSSFARHHPGWAPFILPFLLLYLAFVFLSWVANPLFNLLLRLNRFGRMVLSPEEVRASNWIGACVLGTALALGAAVWLRSSWMAYAALVCGLLIIPLAGTFSCPPGWPRRTMASLTAAMAFCGFASLGLDGVVAHTTATAEVQALVKAVSSLLFGVFVLGAILSPWAANLLMAARLRK
ncbi:MAG: tetratricopeptide repeat protein [Phycisphaerae bacterium]|nr:tetratricopeptide repeat protein [Phycisphaerae bacterium]